MFDAIFPKHWTTLQRLMWLKTNALARAVYETITGNPITFTAKSAPLRQLKVAFSPKQDLHGYNSPWPAGGGKNKYSDVWSEYTKPYEYYVCPITLEQGDWVLSGELTGTTITGCVVGIVKAGTKYSEFVSLRTALNVSGELATHSLTVDSTWTNPHLVIYCTGETQFNSLFSNYHFQLEKSSTASSYAPYENKCPISGWSSLTVEQRGKNLFGGTLKDGHVDFSTVAGATYTVSAKMADPSVPTYLYIRKAVIGSDTYTTVGNVITNLTVTPVTITAEAGYKYALWSNSSYVNVTDVMLELGSTPSAYVPYNPSSRSISITIGQTVYGGTVDVVTGVGMLTHGIIEATTAASASTSSTGINYVSININPAGQLTEKANSCISDTYAYTAGTPSAGSNNVFRVLNTTLYVYDNRFTNLATAQSILASEKPNFVYLLATPIPIQLTPQEVESLAGDNVLFSDSNGDLTVTYRSN